MDFDSIDRHFFRKVWDDGQVSRISHVDTEEFEKSSSPTVPGFSKGDFDAQEDRIRSEKMILKDPENVHVDDKGFEMKKEITESISRGYDDLSRGMKIRILNEILSDLKREGEERRAETMSVRRK